MSSYKLARSFCANVNGSLSFASLCAFLQEQTWRGGYSNPDLCLERRTLIWATFQTIQTKMWFRRSTTQLTWGWTRLGLTDSDLSVGLRAASETSNHMMPNNQYACGYSALSFTFLWSGRILVILSYVCFKLCTNTFQFVQYLLFCIDFVVTLSTQTV